MCPVTGSRGCPIAGSRIPHIRIRGTDAHVDLPLELRPFLDKQAGTADIAPDIRAIGQQHFALADDVTNQVPENDHRAGLKIGFHPGVFADRQMPLVMDQGTFEGTVDDQAFC